MAVLNFRDVDEFNPETYGGEGAGGLLGRLQAIVQPDQIQSGSDAASPSNGVLEFNPPDVQSNPALSPLSGDLAAPPERTFSDRVQAAWDYPHPHGLMRMFKEALNGVAAAVQGSIDATTTPSTEEEAFRQNLGREQGPVGAWQAASLLSPTAPGGTVGIYARPLVDVLRNGLPSLPSGARIAGQGIHGPIVSGLDDRLSKPLTGYGMRKRAMRPVFCRIRNWEIGASI